LGALPARADINLRRIERGIVQILIIVKDEISSTGSGFVVSDEGHILTAAHVVEGENALVLILGRQGDAVQAARAEIMTREPERDIALLRASGMTMRPLVFSRRPPAPNDTVYTVGFPGAAENLEALEKFVKLVDIQKIKSGSMQQIDVKGQGLSDVVRPSISKGPVRKLAGARVPPSIETILAALKADANRWAKVFEGKEGRGPRLPQDLKQLVQMVGDDIRSKRPEIEVIHHDVNMMPGDSGGPLLNEGGEVLGVNVFSRGNEGGTVKFSSGAAVARSVLDARGVRYRVAAFSFHPRLFGVLAQSLGWTTSMAVALVALYTATRKPMRQRLSRMYTTVVGWGKHPRRPVDGGGGGTTTDHPRPLSPVGGCRLEGRDSSGDKLSVRIGPDSRKRLEKGLMIGRKSDRADLVIDDGHVSAQHVKLGRDQEGRFWVEDWESMNGTRLNGKRLERFVRVRIRDGDKLLLGDLSLTFTEDDPGGGRVQRD